MATSASIDPSSGGRGVRSSSQVSIHQLTCSGCDMAWMMAPLPSSAMPAADPNEPVLVGVGQVVHRPEDGPPPELVEMMVTAARRAGDDAGAALLDQVAWVGTPKGIWTHPDPAREVAAA